MFHTGIVIYEFHSFLICLRSKVSIGARTFSPWSLPIASVFEPAVNHQPGFRREDPLSRTRWLGTLPLFSFFSFFSLLLLLPASPFSSLLPSPFSFCLPPSTFHLPPSIFYRPSTFNLRLPTSPCPPPSSLLPSRVSFSFCSSFFFSFCSFFSSAFVHAHHYLL